MFYISGYYKFTRVINTTKKWIVCIMFFATFLIPGTMLCQINSKVNDLVSAELSKQGLNADSYTLDFTSGTFCYFMYKRSGEILVKDRAVWVFVPASGGYIEYQFDHESINVMQTKEDSVEETLNYFCKMFRIPRERYNVDVSPALKAVGLPARDHVISSGVPHLYHVDSPTVFVVNNEFPFVPNPAGKPVVYPQ